MQAIGKWLATFLLDYLVKKIWPRIVAWARSVYEKWERGKRQEKAIEQVEKNATEKKPRDEKVIKDETDFLNS